MWKSKFDRMEAPQGGVTCPSCGAAIVGAYCSACGQKNDDLRRSIFDLLKDFLADTFSFDSRMWRTLGLLVIAPGVVPTDYCHGKRSRYTPPVRLFLVVSFLFFLTLNLTQTMFVAVDIRARQAEGTAAEGASMEVIPRGPAADDSPSTGSTSEGLSTAGETLVPDVEAGCDMDFSIRFFVRPADISVDEEKWRLCSDRILKAAKSGNVRFDVDAKNGNEARFTLDENTVMEGFDRVLAGVNRLISNPVAFNAQINIWLPRVLFFMPPFLALLLALFIRGPDALVFDHLVFSLYGHAVGFVIMGLAITAGQFGVGNVLPVTLVALSAYFVAGLKRGFGRSLVRTILSTLLAGFAYLSVLAVALAAIVSREIWRAAG